MTVVALFPGAAPVHDTAPQCVIPGRPHRADDGTLLCARHLQDLGRTLRDIEEETIDLSTLPSMAIAYDQAGGTAPAFERTPLRIAAAVLTDLRRGTGITRRETKPGDGGFDEHGWDPTPSVLESLHSWAQQVRDERKIRAPRNIVVLHRWTATLPGPVCWHPPLLPCRHRSCAAVGRPVELAITDTVLAPPTVTGERDLLTRQLGWIARQPWVDEFHQEMHDLLAELQRANNSLVTHVGTCGTLRPDGTLCDGKVWHVLIRPDGKIAQSTVAGPDDEPGFRCGTCRRIWTGTDAVRKRHDMWLDEQTKKSERMTS